MTEAYTDEQRATYEGTYAMLVELGFSPRVANVSSRNKAEGVSILPPREPPRRHQCLDDLPAGRAPATNAPLPIEWADGMGEPHAATELVEGVLLRDGLTVVFGATGCGKTRWAATRP